MKQIPVHQPKKQTNNKTVNSLRNDCGSHIYHQKDSAASINSSTFVCFHLRYDLFWTLYKLGSSVDCPNEQLCKAELYYLYISVQLYTLGTNVPC